MTQINIVGQFFGSSGYAVHTRQLSNALFLENKGKVRVSTNLPQGWENDCNDNELLMIKNTPKKDEINLIIALPHQWKLMTKPGRNFAYCVWEGDKVPSSFIEEFLNPDIEKILIPSNHTKQAILNVTDNEEIIKKIKIIPHGVDLNLFKPEKKPDKFTFVANKGFRNLEDRGGIQYLIEAFMQEFKKGEAELFIKINPSYGVVNLNELMKKYSHPEMPLVKINAENIPYKLMNKIYNQGHVFVSPTRADAFNIPCLEAIACGLPVLTTNFGGQTDFVNEENGWLIGGELKEVEHECMYEGIKWLTPNISDLKKALRTIYENPISDKIEKAKETAKNMTWRDSAKKILTLK